jgi:predicted membrane metal-binding protein
LVVSGLHVSIAAIALSGTLRMPFQMMYAFRMVPPVIWPQLLAVFRVLAALIALGLAATVGMGQAAQRAAIGFSLWQLLLVFHGAMPLLRRLKLIAFAQMVLFPFQFFTTATFLSWGAYLFVIYEGRRETNAKYAKLLGLQLKLLVLTFLVIGNVSLFSVLSNLILVPLFPVILVSAWLYVLVPRSSLLADLILWLHRLFLELVENTCLFLDNFPWMVVKSGGDMVTLRYLSIFVVGYLCLNMIKDLANSK